MTERRPKFDYATASRPGEASGFGEDGGPPREDYALVIAWSATQPERIGDIAFFPFGQTLVLGRGDAEPETRAQFARHRPDTPAFASPLDGQSLSRNHMTIRGTMGGLEMKLVAARAPLVNNRKMESFILGVDDTLLFPDELLLVCVKRAVIPSLLHFKHKGLRAFGEPCALGYIGESVRAYALREEVALAGASTEKTLLVGETGTGKELVATGIHKLSGRRDGPLVLKNCAAISPGLVDSEIFGNWKDYPNKGQRARPGLVGQAEGGTLFLDEIGELPQDVQSHLLRLLETGDYDQLGAPSVRHADVRVIGATNRDMSAFRRDFLERFSRRIELPALRERREDIPLLVRHLLLEYADESPRVAGRFIRAPEGERREPRVHVGVIEYLLRCPLDGNVRELRRTVRRIVDANRVGNIVTLPYGFDAPPKAAASSPARNRPAEAEEPLGPPESDDGGPTTKEVRAALAKTNGNVTEAAKRLGVSRFALGRLMTRRGIKRDD